MTLYETCKTLRRNMKYVKSVHFVFVIFIGGKRGMLAIPNAMNQNLFYLRNI